MNSNTTEANSRPLDDAILKHNALTLELKNDLLEKAKEAVSKNDYATATQLMNATLGLHLIF